MKLTTTQAAPTKTTKTNVPHNLRRCCLIFGVLTILAAAQLVVSSQRQARDLEGQAETLAQLHQRIAEATDAVDALPTTPKTPAQVTRAQDDGVAQDFLKQLLTWDGGTAYNDTRTWLSHTYNIGESDALLGVFMPALSDNDTKDSNLKYESSTVVLLQDTAGLRQYMALCDVTNNVDGNTGYGQVAVFYQIASDGTLSPTAAYTLVT